MTGRAAAALGMGAPPPSPPSAFVDTSPAPLLALSLVGRRAKRPTALGHQYPACAHCAALPALVKWDVGRLARGEPSLQAVQSLTAPLKLLGPEAVSDPGSVMIELGVRNAL